MNLILDMIIYLLFHHFIYFIYLQTKFKLMRKKENKISQLTDNRILNYKQIIQYPYY